jgi:hypothetical protein
MTNEFERRAMQQEEPPAKKTRRGLKKQETDTPQTKTPIRWVQLRLIPIWLRIILVVILWVVIAAVGLNVGYSLIGDGQAKDALKWSTWQHLLDIMNGK